MLRIRESFSALLLLLFYAAIGAALPASTAPEEPAPAPLAQHNDGRHVSLALYKSLEELARIVDISYCVGTTGISQPFKCYNHCSNFEGFELVTTWNTGIFASDSCGYIAISHPPFEKRVIVAFRGTYSIANTIVDLSTNPAEYVPFLGDGDENTHCGSGKEEQTSSNTMEPVPPQLLKQGSSKRSFHDQETCANCTVHSGFLTTWRHTRCAIIPHVERALKHHPDYKLTLVGHSLGGAVAALAGLEFQALGWDPQVTTFGEPRIGNRAFNEFLDRRFNLVDESDDDVSLSYRRVTHVNDPVPLLPLEEWGYTMHAGEIFVSRPSVPPSRDDVHFCHGDHDPGCIAGEEVDGDRGEWIPKRYQLWELMFAHRDYFWRLGLCLPGGDPWDWWRVPTELPTDDNDESDEMMSELKLKL